MTEPNDLLLYSNKLRELLSKTPSFIPTVQLEWQGTPSAILAEDPSEFDGSSIAK